MTPAALPRPDFNILRDIPDHPAAHGLAQLPSLGVQRQKPSLHPSHGGGLGRPHRQPPRISTRVRVPLRSTPKASIRRYADRVEVDVWPEDAPDFRIEPGAFRQSPETVTIAAPRPLTASEMPLAVEQKGLIRPLDDPSPALRVVRISVPIDRDWMIRFMLKQGDEFPQEPVFHWQSILMAIAMMLAHPDRPCWARLESKGPWISRSYWEESIRGNSLIVPPGICIAGLPQHQPCIASELSGPLTWEPQSVHIQRFAPLLDLDLAFAFKGAPPSTGDVFEFKESYRRRCLSFSNMLVIWTSDYANATREKLRDKPDYFDFYLSLLTDNKYMKCLDPYDKRKFLKRVSIEILFSLYHNGYDLRPKRRGNLLNTRISIHDI